MEKCSKQYSLQEIKPQPRTQTSDSAQEHSTPCLFWSDQSEQSTLETVFPKFGTSGHLRIAPRILQHEEKSRVYQPLVFILYVNDFGEEIGKSSDVLQFADDTAILYHEKNEQCLEAKAEKILMETEQYMKQNKLTLNEGKTEIMVFKNEKIPNVNCVEFNSQSLKPTDEVRYLGVILDKELTYQKKLNNVISKMALAITSIYLVRNQIPLKARINL